MRKREVVKAPEFCKRDKGKHFLITEWPAERAEKWAVRALIAYNRGGGQIDVDRLAGMGGGMEAIFFLGVETFLRGQMKAEEVIPILDELLDCVKMVRDPSKRDAATGDVVASDIVSEDDVAEIQTRMWLRSEVLRVHTNFSAAAAVSSLLSAVRATMAERAASPNA